MVALRRSWATALVLVLVFVGCRSGYAAGKARPGSSMATTTLAAAHAVAATLLTPARGIHRLCLLGLGLSGWGPVGLFAFMVSSRWGQPQL